MRQARTRRSTRLFAGVAMLPLLVGACATDDDASEPDVALQQDADSDVADGDEKAEDEADAQEDEADAHDDEADAHDDSGHDADAHGGDDAEASADAQHVRVEGSEFSYEPSEVRVEAGRPVAVTYVNVGEVEHDWVLFAPDGTEITHAHVYPGEEATVEFTLEPGTYEVRCTVPGHADAGMVGTVVAE